MEKEPKNVEFSWIVSHFSFLIVNTFPFKLKKKKQNKTK